LELQSLCPKLDSPIELVGTLCSSNTMKANYSDRGVISLYTRSPPASTKVKMDSSEASTDLSKALSPNGHIPNPLEPIQPLKRPLEGEQNEEAHPPQPIFDEDSAVTKAEKIERNGTSGDAATLVSSEPSSKRVKLDQPEELPKVDARDRVKGVASVKAE
jgi:hypothetical protein